MPAITIIPSQVVAGSDADFFQGIAGATVTAGMAVYEDRQDHKLRPADADGGAQAANVKGIALNGAGDGQPVRVQTDGTLAIGGITAVGEQYVLDVAAGGILPADELAANAFVTILGVGASSNRLRLSIEATGQPAPSPV
jgi:hypothetical protein